MFHGHDHLGQRALSGVDLMIDFATLGEYGLEPPAADGSCTERTDRRFRPRRRRVWEASAPTRRGACGTRAGHGQVNWRFPRREPSRADFRAALERYATA
jgi:hypothetical protein